MTERPDVARIPPLPPAEWSATMKEGLQAFGPKTPGAPTPPPSEGRPRAVNALGTFAQHPDLALAYLTFNGHILYSSTLSDRQRELLILRVAAVRRAQYEWAQHVHLAHDAGIDDDEIERVIQGPDDSGWSTSDAALLQAVDELIADAMISPTTWAALAADLDSRQLMDLVFTVGAYDMLAMAFQSFGIQIDDDLKPTTRPL